MDVRRVKELSDYFEKWKPGNPVWGDSAMIIASPIVMNTILRSICLVLQSVNPPPVETKPPAQEKPSTAPLTRAQLAKLKPPKLIVGENEMSINLMTQMVL